MRSEAVEPLVPRRRLFGVQMRHVTATLLAVFVGSPPALAAPGDLTLTSTPLVGDARVTIRVTGALPNQQIILFRASDVAQDGHCPPPIAPDCLDLVPPVRPQLTLTSDASGAAVLQFPFPQGVAQPFVGMQAGYINGSTIDTSNTLLQRVHPRDSDYDNDGMTAYNEVVHFGTDPDVADGDTEVSIMQYGSGVFAPNGYHGHTLWTWRGRPTGRVYCELRFFVGERSSFAGTPPGPGPQSDCTSCDLAIDGIAFGATELTPAGQCAAAQLPGYFTDSAYAFAHGYEDTGVDAFWNYDFDSDLWFRDRDVSFSFDPTVQGWTYWSQTTVPYTPPITPQ